MWRHDEPHVPQDQAIVRAIMRRGHYTSDKHKKLTNKHDATRQSLAQPFNLTLEPNWLDCHCLKTRQASTVTGRHAVAPRVTPAVSTDKQACVSRHELQRRACLLSLLWSSCLCLAHACSLPLLCRRHRRCRCRRWPLLQALPRAQRDFACWRPVGSKRGLLMLPLVQAH